MSEKFTLEIISPDRQVIKIETSEKFFSFFLNFNFQDKEFLHLVIYQKFCQLKRQ